MNLIHFWKLFKGNYLSKILLIPFKYESKLRFKMSSNITSLSSGSISLPSDFIYYKIYNILFATHFFLQIYLSASNVLLGTINNTFVVITILASSDFRKRTSQTAPIYYIMLAVFDSLFFISTDFINFSGMKSWKLKQKKFI